MDELIVYLDIEMEYELKKLMLDLFENWFVFFVMYCLYWMFEMDWIIVLDYGVVVEIGMYEELFLCKGFYYNLVKV